MISTFCFKAIAQDLSKLDKTNAFKMNGGVAASMTGYTVNGIDNRRDPWYWQINANVNFNILGVAVPFTAQFSQQQRSFTQPFNQYGLSPRYKWLTVHLGYRSLNYSTYTLSGNTFLGVGVEVAPENSIIKGSVMYGRFAKAIQFGGNDGQIAGEPAFERWGYGAKITVGTNKNYVDFIMFRGRDDASSIDVSLIDGTDLDPEENLVFGVYTKQQIAKKVKVDFEYAFSAYTLDTRNSDVILNNFSYYNNLGNLYTPNASSQFNRAIKGSVTYTPGKYNLKFAYRRIGPEYRTMGSPFLNNDLEDFTGSVAFRMFKKKLNITTTGGLQRNNLDESQVARTTRLIGNATATYAATPKLNFSANVANYTTTTRKVQIIEFDSLDYFQVTRNAGLGFNYSTGKEKIKHNIFSNGNYQVADDELNNSSKMLNLNSGYQAMLPHLGLTGAASLNVNRAIFVAINSTAIGPTLSVTKSLLKKKVKTSASYSMIYTYSIGELIDRLGSARLTAAYTYKQKHTTSFSGVYVNKKSITGTGTSFNEFRGTLQYGYTF